jgi:hypothetical protein
MSKIVPNFVTVDMRELKTALLTRAQANSVSISALVRDAVAVHLGLAAAIQSIPDRNLAEFTRGVGRVKLSIRMSEQEAQSLALGARSAGLSRGAYLAGLIANVPVLTSGASRAEYVSALIASCAELSGLSRNIHQLTLLLGQGQVRQALVYREALDAVDADVRLHLKLAAHVLSTLQPRAGRAA